MLTRCALAFTAIVIVSQPALRADADESNGKSAVVPAPLHGQIRAGLDHLYNMEYEEADQVFQSLIKTQPDNPAGYAYEAVTCWLREMHRRQELTLQRFTSPEYFSQAGQAKAVVDSALDARIRILVAQTIDKARARLSADKHDKGALFWRGMAYQTLANYEMTMRGNAWAAFRAAAKMYRDYKELLRLDPSFVDARLSTGTYNYVMASLPWSVKWITLVLGYSGDKERGLRDIELAANEGDLVAEDACFMLALLQTREGNFQKARECMDKLRAKYHNNYLLDLEAAWLSMRMGRPADAVTVYKELIGERRQGRGAIMQLEQAALELHLAAALSASGKHGEAAEILRATLKRGDGTSQRNRTLVQLELGKTLERSGNRTDAIVLYREVSNQPDASGSRRMALDLLEKPMKRAKKQ